MKSANRVERMLGLGVPLVPALAVGLYWIWSLARGESLVFERLGAGIRAFPFASLALHGLALGLIGIAGYVVADVLVAVSVYYAARAVLRDSGLACVTAVSLALVVSCGLLSWPGDHFAQWLGWDPRLHLWGFRFPRPFLTDLFMLLCVGLWLRLVLGERDRVSQWVW